VAADLAGVSIDTVARVLTKMSVAASDAAAGNDAMADAFAKAGINAQAFKSAGLDQQLIMLSEAFNKARGNADKTNQIIELMGTQRRTEGLYALPDGAAGLTAPMMLALDKRALKLPSWWLARGLAREAFAYDELRFWQRLYGQDGVSIPFQLQPFRAVHVVRSPARDAANALIVRFSGGPYLPWLRSCSPSVAAHAPRCGRGTAECFRLWRPYLSRALIPLLRDDGAGADAEEDGPVPRLECVDTGSGSLSSRSLDRGLVSEHARGALSGRSHGGQQQQQQAAAEKGQTIEPDTQ
jgi:hypothetical protein